MLIWRSKVLSPSSLGAFVKHLPTSNPRSIPFKFQYNSNEKSQFFTTTAQQTSLFRTLTSQQQQQVDLYIHSLLQWNQSMNLTSVKDKNEAMERHVEDSLAIVEPIRSSYLSHCGTSCENLNVIDVGSGAGLPGLIIAIACQGWKLTLLESMHKRCVFLEHAVGVTGLSNVQVIRERAEWLICEVSRNKLTTVNVEEILAWCRYGQNLGRNPGLREGFDVAVARAVAEMRILAEYCLPLVRVGGLFVAAKGHDPQDEVKRAERAIKLMRASVLRMCPVKSHSKFGQRTAIVCLKEGTTPRKYPRDPGTPGKLPL